MTSADIESAGHHWAMIDTLGHVLQRVPLGDPVITNTDTSSSVGIHWLVVIQWKPNELYIYDPLGKNNNRVTAAGSSSDAFLYAMKSVYYFPYKSQMISSDDCGYFAIMVSDALAAGAIRKNPKEYDKIIISLFGREADRGDVAKLKKYFSKSD